MPDITLIRNFDIFVPDASCICKKSHIHPPKIFEKTSKYTNAKVNAMIKGSAISF